ncbi:N-acetylmuramoyl-L-alanine amidase [Deinococcus ruber]|uniref:N-acetylmuramoyl-L-alanine amidase n=1 Tax=Deinococcus ruber TaxID=1848197 RepID=A0A918CEB8_9DEIO|nr:N-acetylmuramoyl-L-alanine amidase [Deinococcus ruber]
MGTHDGFTRLVIDLPGPTPVRSVLTQGNTVLTVSVKGPLGASQGPLRAAGVVAYVTTPQRLTVQLAAGTRGASVRVLPASGTLPDRLVIDVPVASSSALAPVKAAPAPRQARLSLVRPAVRQPILRVVLDAGHGGVDAGMSSPWVTEKAITLDVALRVRTYLLQRGVQVIMVRSSDTQLSVNKRDDLERRARLGSAASVNAYVSIHVNSSDGAASGIETYYFGTAGSDAAGSIAVLENGGGSTGRALTRQASATAQTLVGDLLSQAKLTFSAQLARSIQGQLIGLTGATDRGVRSDAFYVIRNPAIPAILTEIGFGSNAEEGAKLAQAGYRERVAGAIAQGILKFLNHPL